MASRTFSQTAMYGRNREQTRLRQLLSDTIAGHGALVLISGEAGIGKTMLVHDLIANARDQGCLVLSGGCYDLTTTQPYGPWSEAIRGYEPRDDQPRIPSWFDNFDELGKVGSQTALFDETRRFFADIASQCPLAIILEDLHWSDAASLEALRYLARTLGGTAVLIVATYRADEITRRHELYQLLPLLVRESQAQRIHLNPFDHDDIRALVASRYNLAGEDVARLVDHIAERSEGNPFFASEILQGLEHEQVLQATAGAWELGDLNQTQIPLLLRQVLNARLDRLSPNTQAALQVAAVIGQDVRLHLWAAAHEIDESALLPVLEEALAAGLIEEIERSGRYTLRHALIREALYDGLIWLHRRSLHQHVGALLATQPNPDPDAVAYHFQQADDERAVDWLILAGERAERVFASVIAVEHYITAVRLAESVPGSETLRIRLLTLIARLQFLDDPQRGVIYADEAYRLASELDDRDLMAAAQFYRGSLRAASSQYRAGIADMRAALEHLDTAEGRIVHGMGGRDWERFVLVLMDTGHLEEAELLLHRYQDEQAQSGIGALARGLALLGRLDDAARHFARARESLQPGTHPMIPLSNTGSELYYLAVPFRTDDVAYRRSLRYEHNRAYRQIIEFGATSFPEALAPDSTSTEFDGNWGEWYAFYGRFQQPRGNAFWYELWRSHLGALARHRDEPELAWQLVHELLVNGAATEPGNCNFLAGLKLIQLAAALEMDQDEPERARAWLDAQDRWLEWSGAVLGIADGHLLWARSYQLAGDSTAARDHAISALRRASNPRQPMTLIHVQCFLGQIATSERDYPTAVDYLTSALELAEACELPFERARTLLAQADLAARTDKSPEARRLLNDARALLTPLGARRSLNHADEIETRLRHHMVDHPAGLSDREVEVLEQAATGLTNAKIGEVLYISPRTVAQHLRSVYNKLGVNSRAAAVGRWAELTNE